MNESWHEPGGAEIFIRKIRLISGQHTAVASGKLLCGQDPSNSEK
jgi:hypothetical protein